MHIFMHTYIYILINMCVCVYVHSLYTVCFFTSTYIHKSLFSIHHHDFIENYSIGIRPWIQQNTRSILVTESPAFE